MKLDFKGWRIGFIFGTFCMAMGSYETCQYLNSIISLISSLIGYIFKKIITQLKRRLTNLCYSIEIISKRGCRHAYVQLVKNRA
jgi:hypothetical protein